MRMQDMRDRTVSLPKALETDQRDDINPINTESKYYQWLQELRVLSEGKKGTTLFHT